MSINFRGKFFAVSLLSGIMFCAKAQFNIDSFILINNKKPYPEKIKNYLDIGNKVGTQKFDDVIKIAEEGISIAQKQSDLSAVGVFKRRIGESYYFKGDYNKAAEYYYSSIKIFEEKKEQQNLANSYNVLAKLYRKTRDIERSLKNYDAAMANFRAVNDSAGIAMIYNESGVVFGYKGDYKEAAARYSASLVIDEIRKDTIGICYALSNLASVYTMQNDFIKAENYLQKSLNFCKLLKDQFSIALNYSELANTLSSAKKYEKAIMYIDSSNHIANMMGYPELRRSNYEQLANIAEQNGDFKKALTYNKLTKAINDSIFNIEKSKKIEELNTLYETEKKERTIEIQKNKITIQNTMMVAGIILFLFACFLAYAQYRRYQWRQEAKMKAQSLMQQENAVRAVMDAEDAERRRIATDLHDGVGQVMSAAKMNLSAFEHVADFKNLEQKQNFQKIISLVDAGCKEVRAVSHNMMPTALLKNNLPDAIDEFISKLDSTALKVHLHSEGFDSPINSNVESVLYRIIQECVNNVIKHSGATVLDISLTKEANEITATIEDNGRGFDTNKIKDENGIGLKNIFTRVEFLRGTIDLSSAPGKGTQMAIYIPLDAK